jgi:hypothetical protein
MSIRSVLIDFFVKEHVGCTVKWQYDLGWRTRQTNRWQLIESRWNARVGPRPWDQAWWAKSWKQQTQWIKSQRASMLGKGLVGKAPGVARPVLLKLGEREARWCPTCCKLRMWPSPAGAHSLRGLSPGWQGRVCLIRDGVGSVRPKTWVLKIIWGAWGKGMGEEACCAKSWWRQSPGVGNTGRPSPKKYAWDES